MRYVAILGLLACGILTPAAAQDKQEKSEGPTSQKAQKAFHDALDYLHMGRMYMALDAFKKADKEDGGRCLACQKKIIKYALETGEWKAAESAAGEMVAEAQSPKESALAHYELGVVLYQQAVNKHKDDLFPRAHAEFTAAVAAFANFPAALFSDGQTLAHMRQDDAAKAQFEAFAKLKPEDDPQRQRAFRYISNMELARARMAPAFAATTLDGRRISLDDLAGKVVLLDFWATWCGPCREALPHLQKIAKKFEGQPLVVLSVSLDADEVKWKDFIAKNSMTWPQCRDGGFTGPIARQFGVTAIPHTFTIDADGVLEDEHIGDASVEGKLKKLVARAQELQETSKRTAQ